MINEKFLSTMQKIYTWDSPIGISYKLTDVKQITEPNFDGLGTYEFDFQITDHGNKDKVTNTKGVIELWIPSSENKIGGKQVIHIAQENKHIICRYDKLIIGSITNLFNNEADSWVLTFDNSYKHRGCYINRPDRKSNEDIKIDIRALFKYYSITDLNDINFNNYSISVEDENNIKNIIDDFYIDDKTVTTIKYINKTNDVSNKLSSNLVQNIANIWNQRKEIDDARLYSPLDFDYMNYYQVLDDYLTKRKNGQGWAIMTELRNDFSNHWVKDGKPSLVKLQSKFGDLIRGNKSPLHDVNEPMEVSPSAINSQNNKLIFKRKTSNNDIADIKLWTNKFIGFIDPVFTSDNANVAVKNELCKDANFNDGEITITLYDKSFKEVKIPLDRYVVSGVLSSDNVDYDNKKIIKDNNGEYTIYKYGSFIHTKDENQIDYIRKQDGVCSDVTASIPFINKNYEMRGMLASHMTQEQSVHTISSIPDVLYTGVGKKIYDKSDEVVRAKEDGVVTLVRNDMIAYTNDKNESKIIPYTHAKATGDHTGALYRSTVKEGDKIKVGDPIIENIAFDDKDLSLQVPLLTAFTDYDAYTHEDAVVLSYSAAQKLGHSMVKTVEIPIPKDHELYFEKQPGEKYDELGIIKEGTIIDENTRCLMKYKYTVKSDELDRDIKLERNITVPKFITRGFVEKVRWVKSYGFSNVKTSNIVILDEFFKDKERRAMLDIKKTTNANKDDINKALYYEDKYASDDPNIVGKILIDIVYVNYGKIGDKITSRYGSKGVIGLILPDEQMPRTKDGQITEILMSPLALFNRKIPAQLYESSLTTISKKIFDELNARYGNGTVKSTVSDNDLKECIKIIYHEDEKIPTLKELYSKNKEYGFVRIRVAAMDTYFTRDVLKTLEDKLGIEMDQQLFIPKYNTWTKQKIRIGWQSFYRTKFFVENKAKASPRTNILKSQKDDSFKSISGYGKTRPYAKIGEQENWILKSYGQDYLIKHFMANETRDEKASKMLSNLLSLSLILKDDVDEDKKS